MCDTEDVLTRLILLLCLVRKGVANKYHWVRMVRNQSKDPGNLCFFLEMWMHPTNTYSLKMATAKIKINSGFPRLGFTHFFHPYIESTSPHNTRTACFPVHAMIVSHYMNGAWFPKGGPLSLARPLVSTIFKGGGGVFVRAPVQQIEVGRLTVSWISDSHRLSKIGVIYDVWCSERLRWQVEVVGENKHIMCGEGVGGSCHGRADEEERLGLELPSTGSASALFFLDDFLMHGHMCCQ